MVQGKFEFPQEQIRQKIRVSLKASACVGCWRHSHFPAPGRDRLHALHGFAEKVLFIGGVGFGGRRQRGLRCFFGLRRCGFEYGLPEGGLGMRGDCVFFRQRRGGEG